MASWPVGPQPCQEGGRSPAKAHTGCQAPSCQRRLLGLPGLQLGTSLQAARNLVSSPRAPGPPFPTCPLPSGSLSWAQTGGGGHPGFAVLPAVEQKRPCQASGGPPHSPSPKAGPKPAGRQEGWVLGGTGELGEPRVVARGLGLGSPILARTPGQRVSVRPGVWRVPDTRPYPGGWPVEAGRGLSSPSCPRAVTCMCLAQGKGVCRGHQGGSLSAPPHGSDPCRPHST